jgi:hypothetical protein
MGESALVVLAVANPVRDRLDGREPFCALAGRVVRGYLSVCWNCLLSSNEETYCPSWAKLSPGRIDWKRQKGRVSVFIYIVAIPLSFLQTWIACACYAMVAIMWLLPDPRIEKKLGNEPLGL